LCPLGRSALLQTISHLDIQAAVHCLKATVQHLCRARLVPCCCRCCVSTWKVFTFKNRVSVHEKRRYNRYGARTHNQASGSGSKQGGEGHTLKQMGGWAGKQAGGQASRPVGWCQPVMSTQAQREREREREQGQACTWMARQQALKQGGVRWAERISMTGGCRQQKKQTEE